MSTQNTAPTFGAKSVSVKFKTDGLSDGEFLGYASVFGNKDSYGDVVVKGAFAKTLTGWREKGLPIPILWDHNTSDPDYNLGAVITAEEDDRGLKIHGRLDLDSPKAAQAYRLLKAGRVGQMSFAYSVIDGAYVQTADDSFYELRELDLYEVSIVPIGANQETEILAVKAFAESLRAKAGRVYSAKSEDTLRSVKSALDEASQAIENVLNAIGDSGEKAQDQTSGEEPPAGTKSPVPAMPSPSVSLAMTRIQTISQGDVEQ